MVFFTCNACGESLKKAQIQKHTGICRGARVFSCIDCGKDFRGDDYKNHVKCITEDQKYGGKNYEAKANKGDVKQQQWIERIQEALNKPGVNARLKSVLQQVAAYDNVPRKKAKFQNWMKNSLRIYDSGLQDQVWDIFSSSTDTTATNGVQHTNTEQQAEQTAPAMPEPEVEEKADKKKKNKRERKEERQQKGKKGRMDNGNVEDQQNGEHGAEERGKKKKRKRMEEGEHEEEKPNKIKKKKKEEESEESPNTEEVQDEQEVQEEANTKGKFNWKGTIKAVLRQAPEEGISLKKLRKKVITEYYSFAGDENHKSDEELYSLFNKKLNNPKFRMVKDKVRLIK